MKNVLKNIFIKLIIKVTLLLTNNKLPNFQTILILIPHPDDEILGLGGFILNFLQSGGKVHLVYLTDGEGSGVYPDQEEIKRQRIALSEKVREKLGINSEDVTRLHLNDGKIPNRGQRDFSKTVQIIKDLIEKIKPDVVFATHVLDYWPFDHVACALITKEAVKQSAFKTQLWYYWVWAWYNLLPLQLFTLSYKNMVRVDIRKQLGLKRELTGIYLNALTPEGKPWTGVLPRALVAALDQPFEIIEEIDFL